MIDPRRLRVLQAVATHGSVAAAGALPPLGGRHIAAWHQAGPAQPAPATAAVLDAIVHAARAPQQAP
jgi:hypothetical protein